MDSKFNEKLIQGASLSKDFLAAFTEVSIPLQVAMLRRHYGFSQTEIAKELDVKQAYFSRLEHDDFDHLLSQYENIARLFHARLALIPLGATVTTREIVEDN